MLLGSMVRLGRPARLMAIAVVAVVAVNLLWYSRPTRPRWPPHPSFFQAGPTLASLRYVNPLIGTVNGGHVFPGATLPYGMAKAVADTNSKGEAAAGYVSDDEAVLGFSHLHDSGTGGAASLGNFPLWVHPGCPADNYTLCAYASQSRMTRRVNESAVASPGYFSIALENGVRAEMTATMRTALYKFSFARDAVISSDAVGTLPSVVPNPLILVDLQDLARTRTKGDVKVLAEKKRMLGHGTFRPSFGRDKYKAYFCADFSGATVKGSGTFKGDIPTSLGQAGDDETQDWTGSSGANGGWLHFDDVGSGHILARVGLSFISPEQACDNGELEVPDFDFEKTKMNAELAWENKLSAVEVDASGVSHDLQTTFWSGLYRSFLSPQNYTGENPLWKSSEPYFDSFYCIWDSFRAQHPLLTILDPLAQTEMVRSLLDIYQNAGHLPDCRMSFCKGFSQGGSNADVVVADAFIKNLTDGIDWNVAYKALLADAYITPQDWSIEGRGNLESWENYHYIAADHQDHKGSGPQTRTVSRTVEYAYDDYCISVVAGGLGFGEEAQKFMSRSGYWRNVWNPEQRDVFEEAVTEKEVSERLGSDFVGFPQPRLMSGEFQYQNPHTCSPVHDMHRCYFDTRMSTYEGSPWLYSFYAPQDMASLIEVFGGADKFVERLEYFHSSGIAYMGNEQSYLTVYQFHYAGRPGLSAKWVNEYIPSQFNSSIDGIPGNDDCAMGAFSAMAMMGFFPVAGQDVYLLSGPFFPEIRLRSRGSRPAVIRRKGDQGGIYIQRATLDGQDYTKSWITHSFFLDGGELELFMGKEEGGEWGTRDADLPPSHPPPG